MAEEVFVVVVFEMVEVVTAVEVEVGMDGTTVPGFPNPRTKAGSTSIRR